MAKPLTAEALIESIKRRAAVPENQATFTSDDFLSFANEEMLLGLVPSIMSLHEDHLLFEEEVSVEANRSDYEIPSRAMGNKLRDVQHKTDNNHLTEMTRIGIGERFSEYDVRSETNLKKYYVKGNKIVLTPSVGSNAGGILVFVYYMRPSGLVLEDRIGVVQGINDLNNGFTQIVLNQIPENFSTNIIYDLYKSDAPNSILAIDLAPTGINTVTKTVTFATTDIPKELKVGDHLAQAQESNIPQIPSELHSMLAQMVACRILEAQGDTQGLQNALVKLKQMEDASGILIDNRVEDSPQKIVNRHGLVRTSIFSKRFNRR